MATSGSWTPTGPIARQLTSGPADDHSEAWSRDGTRLAFWSVDPTGSPASLVVVTADGSDRLTIFTDDDGRTSEAGVDWSPDGSRIAFTLPTLTSVHDLFVVASDGTGSTTLEGPTVEEAYRLAWSPDGETIAFGGRLTNEPLGAYVMTKDGSDVRRISRFDDFGEGSFASVAWSADGARVLSHAGTDAGGPDIWSFAADGSEELNLTPGPATGFLPSWSPDDAWVAYRDGDIVFLVPGKGGKVRVIGRGAGFAFSPDGSTLALESGRGLHIVDLATGDTVAEIADLPGVGSWQRIAP